VDRRDHVCDNPKTQNGEVVHMPIIDELLRKMVESKSSDLHLTSGYRPYLRLHGEITEVSGWDPLTNESNRAMIQEILPEKNRRELDERWDTDFAYEVPGMDRFRVNVFFDNHGIGAVLRRIPCKIPSVEELGLPPVVQSLCHLSKGLVVVTGPTGSGKSTTLAAIIDLINRSRADHIITIEDPIEFVHQSKRCLVNQREVFKHTRSFANALRAALREDPDIVLVGEMRDLETIEIALETAETGHLVFGTLHTNTAATTVDRIIDKFPADRQNQVRTMLASSLRAVIAQTLCKKIGGGRLGVYEVLVVNTGIASNIREGKTFMIQSALQTGKNEGMQTFTDELLRAVMEGKVTPEEAYMKVVDKVTLREKLEQAGFVLNLSVEGVTPAGHAPAAAPDRTAEYEAIIQHSRQTLQSDPNNLDAMNNIAWIRATHPKLRDGREALKMAERANAATKGNNATILDTLGAAQAEVGNFKAAIESARKALALASAAGDNATVATINQQLKCYLSGNPYREE
jgi:twitching motility protein PilT